jgi:hypothetical protein
LPDAVSVLAVTEGSDVYISLSSVDDRLQGNVKVTGTVQLMMRSRFVVLANALVVVVRLARPLAGRVTRISALQPLKTLVMSVRLPSDPDGNATV